MMQRSAPPAFPEALNDDDDDVTWALQTAGVQWRRGAHSDAIEWLRRAVESAVDGGKATRARDIQQQTNALEAALSAGWKPGSAVPAAAARRPSESPAAPWSTRPPLNSQPPDSPRPFPLRSPRPGANPFLSGPTDNPFLSPAPAPVRRPSGFPPPPKPLPRPGFDEEGAEMLEPDTYNELAVDIDIEAESARGVPTERSRFDPTSNTRKPQEVVEELPLDDVEEDFDDADVIALSSGAMTGGGRQRIPLVSAPELETGPEYEADDVLAQEIDEDEDDDRPTLPPTSSTREGAAAKPSSGTPRSPPVGASRGRVQTEPFPLPRLPEARSSSLPAPPAPNRGSLRAEGLPRPPHFATETRGREVTRSERERASTLRSEPAPPESTRERERERAAPSEQPRSGRPKFAYTPEPTDSVAPKSGSSARPEGTASEPPLPRFESVPPLGDSVPPGSGRDSVPLPRFESAPPLVESMPAYVLSVPPGLDSAPAMLESVPPTESVPAPAEEEPTDRAEAPQTELDGEDPTERSLEVADPIAASSKNFSEPPSDETTERDLDTVPEHEGAPSSRRRPKAPESEPGTSPDLRVSFPEEKPPSVAPDTENEIDREASHRAKSVPQGPAELEGILLGSVPGLEDLPEESQAELASSAEIDTLAASEEVAGFGLALVLEGAVAVMPTIADVAAAHARRGELVFGKTHVDEAVPMRVVAGPDGAKVATWPAAAFDAAISACPWVGDELMVVGDRLQTLVGVAMGPIGDQLDDMLRAMVIERCQVRHLLPGEAIAEAGKPIPGMIIVGAGRLEIESKDGNEIPGPGEFVFAPQILQAAPAPATARAGKGGALILFADRKTAHELMVSVPPLLGIFA